MNIADITRMDCIILDASAGSVKRVLQIAAEHASDITSLTARELMDGLIARERLGSTSVGAGAAIPHARFDHVEEPVGIFLKLNQHVDVGAVDAKGADLFFCLIAPSKKEASHSRLLSRLMRLLGDPFTTQRLRECESAAQIYSILTADDVAVV